MGTLLAGLGVAQRTLSYEGKASANLREHDMFGPWLSVHGTFMPLVSLGGLWERLALAFSYGRSTVSTTTVAGSAQAVPTALQTLRGRAQYDVRLGPFVVTPHLGFSLWGTTFEVADTHPLAKEMPSAKYQGPAAGWSAHWSHAGFTVLGQASFLWPVPVSVGALGGYFPRASRFAAEGTLQASYQWGAFMLEASLSHGFAYWTLATTFRDAYVADTALDELVIAELRGGLAL